MTDGSRCHRADRNRDLRSYRVHGSLAEPEKRRLEKGIIEIFSESGHKYVKIKTDFFLPIKEMFVVLDIIARYLKS
jgi:hypothetical protein